MRPEPSELHMTSISTLTSAPSPAPSRLRVLRLYASFALLGITVAGALFGRTEHADLIRVLAGFGFVATAKLFGWARALTSPDLL